MIQKPFLSLIFPAHNEEQRIPNALEKAIEFLNQQEFTGEIIVVENGSSDRTYEVACSYQDQFENLIILRTEVRGKGVAVKTGMLAASGDYRMFLDVDLSMPIEDVSNFIPPQLEKEVDIAISTREGVNSNRIGEPGYRHFMGRIFNTLIRLLIMPKFQDSQSGFKCFRGEVAEDLFKKQTVNGMAFDSEILYIAIMRDYTIKEIGINWFFDTDSRVRLVRDTFDMIRDTFHIKQNHRRGLYNHD